MARAANECGPVNTATNPHSVTCTSAGNFYQAGITYNDQTQPTPGDLQVTLASGANVSSNLRQGVTVVGSANHLAALNLAAGSSVNLATSALQVTASGAGSASIDNFGLVTSSTAAATALADPAGSASVRNEAGATMTAFSGVNPVGISATGGTVNVFNAGTLSSVGGAGTAESDSVTGVVALSTSTAGGATIGNTGSVTEGGGAISNLGLSIGAGSLGASSITNAGTLTVNAGQSRSSGATGLTSAISIAGGSSASVVDGSGVAQGSTIANNSFSGAVTGINVAGVSGPVTVTNLGSTLSVMSNNGLAQGVAIGAGSSATVRFADAKSGSAILSSDVAVTSQLSSATGVSVLNTTGPASISFTGASLSVRAAATATGVSVTANQDVNLSTAIDGVTGARATMSVVGASNGTFSATGVNVSAPAHNVNIAIGDDFTVAGNNTAGNTAGISVGPTASTLISFSPSAAVTVSGASATGIALVGNGGAATVHLPTLMTVTGGGSGTGVSFQENGVLSGSAPVLIDGGGLTVNTTLASPTTLTQTTGVSIARRDVGAPTTVNVGPLNISTNSTVVGSNTSGVVATVRGAATVTTGAITLTGTGGAGVSVNVEGADGSININASSITANSKGLGQFIGVSAGYSRQLGESPPTGDITVNVGRINITAGNGIGVAAANSTTNGAVTVTDSDMSFTGTSGDSVGVLASTTLGALTVNNTGLIQIAGTGTGISATSSGTVVINSNAVSSGFGGGAISVTAPNVLVNSFNATVTGAVTNAIVVNGLTPSPSTTNTATVNIAAGGAAISQSGIGVLLNVSGVSTLNLGAGAAISGGGVGVLSQGAGTTTINLAGVVGSRTGSAAIQTTGHTLGVINNTSGVINGFLDLNDTTDTVNNAGVWNATGASNFHTGTSVVNNTGAVNVAPAAATATTVSFGGLTSLNNAGVLNLAQGHTGDVLNASSAAYVGSGGAKLVLDVNPTSVAVGASPARSADVLQVASASGSTAIVLNDVGGAPTLGAPIRLVTAGTSAPGAFTLATPAPPGFIVYQLASDGPNIDLVTAPAAAAFETVKAPAEAGRFWRRSGDLWADQMRLPRGAGAVNVWGQAATANDRTRSSLSYTPPGGTFAPLAVDLGVRDRWTGGQVGIDLLKQGWLIGLTAGYGDQTSRFRSNADELELEGSNIGLYAATTLGPVFVNGLLKYDDYRVRFGLASASFSTGTRGKTLGAEVQAGLHLTAGSAYLEPVVSVSHSQTKLDGFDRPDAAILVNYPHADSNYASLGVRAGYTYRAGGYRVGPYAGLYAESEFDGRSRADVALGGVEVDMADPTPHGRGRAELGVVAQTDHGLAGFIKLDDGFGRTQSGLDARLGLSWRW